jgi:hypothetical protein
MLEMIELNMDDTVAWRISGKITEDDLQRALEAAREKIAEHGKISVYQEIGDFSGVEFDAIVEKMQFLRDFGISSFRKIAVVTDKRWMQTVIGWEDKIFRSVDMRAFSTEERDRAINFLAYEDGPEPTDSDA